MATDEDPLHRIAESLDRLEKLYAEELRHREKQHTDFVQLNKDFDERQKTRDKENEEWHKKNISPNPWFQPYQLAAFLLMLAMLVLAITVFLLVRR